MKLFEKKYTPEEIKKSARLILRSYGIKQNKGNADVAKGYTSIPIADICVDCRVITERGIKGGEGTSEVFQAGVQEASGNALHLIFQLIEEGIRKIPDRRTGKPKPFAEPVEILFFCAWGIHRSVATKNIVGRMLQQAGYYVDIDHTPSYELLTDEEWEAYLAPYLKLAAAKTEEVKPQ